MMGKREYGIRLSIVTVCRKNGKGLARTADSLLRQEMDGLEWIIARGEGVSLKELEGCPARWVEIVALTRERVASLMNKAVEVAGGRWVLFLPPGAVLMGPTTLALYGRRFDDCYDIVAGSTWIKGLLGMYPEKAIPLERMEDRMPFRLESTFFRRQALLENPFDDGYPSAYAFELLLRLKATNAIDLICGEAVAMIEERISVDGWLGFRAMTERRRALGKGGWRHAPGWCLSAIRLLPESIIRWPGLRSLLQGKAGTKPHEP